MFQWAQYTHLVSTVGQLSWADRLRLYTIIQNLCMPYLWGGGFNVYHFVFHQRKYETLRLFNGGFISTDVHTSPYVATDVSLPEPSPHHIPGIPSHPGDEDQSSLSKSHTLRSKS